jgi:hypothetical protein
MAASFSLQSLTHFEDISRLPDLLLMLNVLEYSPKGFWRSWQHNPLVFLRLFIYDVFFLCFKLMRQGVSYFRQSDLIFKVFRKRSNIAQQNYKNVFVKKPPGGGTDSVCRM